MVLHVSHADYVCLEKQMLDLAQLKNEEIKMKYFSALMATVLGNEDERAAALEYLKEVDPEIWDQEE
jgi:hypothetical protein